MSGAIQISPDSLRDVAGLLNQVGQQLDQLLTRLEQEIMSMGQPWGNDEIGQLIGVAFEEVVSFAFECLRGVLDEILQSGTDLIAMADRYEAAEQSFIDNFRMLGDTLGSR